MMRNEKDFCCEEINSHLFRSDKNISELHLDYYPVFREYSIDYKEEFGGGNQLINFCPWCGSKLPSTLREKFFTTLKKEYNIEVGIGDYKQRIDIPSEFKSDE